VLDVLRELEMIDGDGIQAGTSVRPPKMIAMEGLFMKRDADDSLAHDWNHLDAFKRGDLLATTAAGEKIVAPFDGYMILPKKNHPVGTEWFYIGRATE